MPPLVHRCKDLEMRKTIMESTESSESLCKTLKRAEMSVMSIPGGPTHYNYRLAETRKRADATVAAKKPRLIKERDVVVDDDQAEANDDDNDDEARDVWLEFFGAQHVPCKSVAFLGEAPETVELRVACGSDANRCDLRVRFRRSSGTNCSESKKDASVETNAAEKNRGLRESTIGIARQYMEKAARRRDRRRLFEARHFRSSSPLPSPAAPLLPLPDLPPALPRSLALFRPNDDAR